ncbi:MAG TPA: isoprenylcysteine carboxylmethyltransferase family protein [Anaeromyxobacteraceae bacterium]|nr:isoprenylcysteine carboxylmethyltransferase family protein [Anaeromyxobacteraceae bacterium]
MALRLLLASGWLVQGAGFAAALARQGRRAAEPAEWPRELLLRLGMAGLVVWALLDPAEPVFPVPPLAAALLAGLFAAGQLLATWARATLGASWGVGVAPRGPPVRRGPYRLVPHPIYAGNLAALLSQAALLQVAPALALAGAALLVIPVKARLEARGLPPPGAGQGGAPPGGPG